MQTFRTPARARGHQVHPRIVVGANERISPSLHRVRGRPGGLVIRQTQMASSSGANGLTLVKRDSPPTKQILDLWQRADAVCFDIDCENLSVSFLSRENLNLRPFLPTSSGTITVNDTLDLLAEHMGVGKEVAEITKKVCHLTRSLEL